MKYEKEIKQLEAERDQVKAQIDKAVAIRKEVDARLEILMIDYNGIVKAIKILIQMGTPEKETKQEGG